MANRALIPVLVCLICPLAARADDVRAGAAKIDITPSTGFPMWGYSSRKDKPSAEVRDALHARAVVLQVDKTKLAFVALDLGRAPPRASREKLAQAIHDKAGIEHFFLVASHTHHGPVIETENWPDPKKPYVRDLEKKLIDVILQADRALEPATLGIVHAEVDFNRNRHSKLADRQVDRELIVVRLDHARSGKSIAHLVNFAAHPTMLPDKLMAFSADFPGVLAKHVEDERGGLCLFLQGAAGDLSPERKHGGDPEAFGKKLGETVLEMSKEVKAEKLASIKAVRREFTFEKRVDLSNPLIRAAYSAAFFPELIAFYEREYREGIRPETTAALLDGRIGIVGVSGEFFCAHALALKKRARLEHLLFLGYCNDYQQYFPTIEAVAEGGYGADATVSPVEIGAGERMMNRALVDLYQMRGKLAK